MSGTKFLCGAAALLCGTSAWAQAGEWRLSEASGRVVVRDAAGDHPAARGSVVPAGATLMTGPGARAVAVRGEDFVTVAANSRLRVPEVAQSQSLFQMIEEWGSAVFKIKHLPRPHFAVQTPYLAAVVKGTTFSVTVTGEGASLQVIDGAVEVATSDGGAHDLVRPGVVATVTAADRFRLAVQGQASRVIDSPARPAADSVPAASATGTSVNGGSEPQAQAGTAPNDDVAWGDVSSSIVAAPITAKPVDLSGVTGGMVGGSAGAEVAALVAPAVAPPAKLDAPATATAPAAPAASEAKPDPAASPPASAGANDTPSPASAGAGDAPAPPASTADAPAKPDQGAAGGQGSDTMAGQGDATAGAGPSAASGDDNAKASDDKGAKNDKGDDKDAGKTDQNGKGDAGDKAADDKKAADDAKKAADDKAKADADAKKAADDAAKKAAEDDKKAADDKAKADADKKKAADDAAKKAADDDKKAADDAKKAADDKAKADADSKKTQDDLLKKAAEDAKKAADDLAKAQADLLKKGQKGDDDSSKGSKGGNKGKD